MGAGMVYDGNTRVWWLDDDPTNVNAPTVAEIGAGEDVTAYLAIDGLAFNMGNSRVSGADLLSAFDSESMGRFQAAPSLTFKLKLRDGGEVAWTTLGDRGVTGCLVVRLSVPHGTAVAAAQKVMVFPTCETGIPNVQNTAANTEERFVVDLAVGNEPKLKASVAA